MLETQQLESPEQAKWTFVSWIKAILGICMVIFLCIFIASTNGMVQKYRTTMQLSQQHALATTQTIADSINDQLTALASAANELAENLREISWSQETIDTALNEAALNHFGFNALGVAFDLYQADSQLRLFAPFIRQQGTTYQLDRIDQYYDYTGHAAYSAKNGNSKNGDWYLQATGGRSGWLAPYFDMAYQQHTLKYVVPLQINTSATKVSGVVFLDIDLDWVRQQVENHDVGDNGYATSHDKMPELYFNLEISRNILNPFIAHLFPLAVVLLMLYGLVLTISKQEAKLTFTGFNVSTIVAACSALFFILLIMHVQLRDELAVNTIVYLEYFYLVSYITILMVTVNAVLISYDPPLGILAFKDNFIPKLIYWPILLTWIFTITAILF